MKAPPIAGRLSEVIHAARMPYEPRPFADSLPPRETSAPTEDCQQARWQPTDTRTLGVLSRVTAAEEPPIQRFYVAHTEPKRFPVWVNPKLQSSNLYEATDEKYKFSPVWRIKLTLGLTTWQKNYVQSLHDDKDVETLESIGDMSEPEIKSRLNLAELESRWSKQEVEPFAPTAAQGAHTLAEHAPPTSPAEAVFHAARDAVAHRKNSNKKTAWKQYEMAEKAVRKAMADTKAAVEEAKKQDDPSKKDLPKIANHFKIFTTDADTVLGDGWEHGKVSGTAGNAEAKIRGEHKNDQYKIGKNALKADVTGTVTGPDTADAKPASDEAATIKLVEGNGRVRVTISAAFGKKALKDSGNNNQATQPDQFKRPNKQLVFTFKGVARLDNARAIVTVGDWAVDGRGSFEQTLWVGDSKLTHAAKIPPDERKWTHDPLATSDLAAMKKGKVKYNLPKITLSDGGKQKQGVSLGEGEHEFGPEFTSRLDQSFEEYTPGVKDEISSSKAKFFKEIKGDLEVKVRSGGAFEARTPKDLVENPAITGRPATYRKAPSDEKQCQLLDSHPSKRYSASDLGLSGDLAAYDLEVKNIKLVQSSTEPDIATLGGSPTAGTVYQFPFRGKIFEFKLESFDSTPGITDAEVNMFLENTRPASYGVFTAFPKQ